MTASTKVAYLDCFSGISGDMFLGALLNAGLPQKHLLAELKKLHLEPFEFISATKNVSSIAACSVTIHSQTKRSFRNLSDITAILEASSLEQSVIDKSLTVFNRLAVAEAQVHGKPVEEIHFHEVGALDTIIDVVGTIAGLSLLGVETLLCSPLPLGRGFVRCAHGNLPLPAPAVCNLLEHVPVYGVEAETELVTPTGAALAVSLAESFCALPPMTITATGYGAGDHAGTDDRPNLLRLFIGWQETVSETQQVEVIETNIDDWNPEGFPYLFERLFANDALDVSLVPIQMKKGRPGICLQVICHFQHGPKLKEIILSETSAIGLRFRNERRMTLPRETVLLSSRWGSVSAKKVQTPAGIRVYPEYESCRIIAAKHELPLECVYREVLVLARDYH